MRKLVQIKTVTAISPIENADAIEVAAIGGWKIVIRKGEFSVGDSVLYFEIDSFLPGDVPEFAFLLPRGAKTLVNEEGVTVTGHVLRTAKLRGQISQGLALPLSWGLTATATQEDVDAVFTELGVFKYEPVNANPELQVGVFPRDLTRKTYSERVQNLSDAFLQSLTPEHWVATEKIDGVSASFANDGGRLRIAGRNWELKAEGNHFHARVAQEYDLASILPVGAVIQGEVFGQGAPSNTLQMKGAHLRIFSWSLPEGVSPTPEFEKLIADHGVPHLPVKLPSTVEEAIEQVYGMKSFINPQVQAEGIVWWNTTGELFDELDDRGNFKAINDKYLLRHGG